MNEYETERFEALARDIRNARAGQAALRTELATSDRVLRRVSDGIYREPWSALRELISNAYDADATEVYIETDAPRFARVTIRDNGFGFTSESLAAMLTSIGGSVKRTQAGAAIGVTAANDPTLTPAGRRIIGKLGIGLFAVSQLTKQFQVITKRKGDTESTVADVILHQYSEEREPLFTKGSDRYRSGTAEIWKVPARNKKSQGTEIILTNLLPRTKRELSSRDLWAAAAGPRAEGEGEPPEPPMYHIGRADPANESEFLSPPVLPWGKERDPDKRFSLFVDAMMSRADDRSVRRPSLNNTFDNYLKFLWLLSLAVPLDYIDQHPFDLDAQSGIRVFKVGNKQKSRAEEVLLKRGETVRKVLGLASPERGSAPAFRVVIDGVALRRPVRFHGLPKSAHAVQRPLLFIGRDVPDLSRVPEEVRGGDLEFEAYLLWCPRVVPVEHNGVLVRINDASGTLFDETFLGYQVSEQTRLRQVSGEVFVMRGLDAALNIDRENFNVSHPHYQYLASWVHNAFKQFATRHKDLSKEARATRAAAAHRKEQGKLEAAVAEIVDRWTEGDEEPIAVVFAKNPTVANVRGSLVLDEEAVLGELRALRPIELATAESTLRAIAQVLHAAGVIETLSRDQKSQLLADIARILFRRYA